MTEVQRRLGWWLKQKLSSSLSVSPCHTLSPKQNNCYLKTRAVLAHLRQKKSLREMDGWRRGRERWREWGEEREGGGRGWCHPLTLYCSPLRLPVSPQIPLLLLSASLPSRTIFSFMQLYVCVCASHCSLIYASAPLSESLHPSPLTLTTFTTPHAVVQVFILPSASADSGEYPERVLKLESQKNK